MSAHATVPPPVPHRKSREADDLIAYLALIGGLGARVAVRRRFTRAALRDALASGHVRPLGQNRLALATAADDVVAAHRLGGVLSQLSAAIAWGWDVLVPPTLPQVTMPRGRHLRTAKPRCNVRWLDLKTDDIRDGATSPLRTVLDCAATLPFVEALAVADSALRSGLVEPNELRDAARRSRGPGSAAHRRVAAVADPRAESVLESAARALIHDIDGISLDLQVEITGEALTGSCAFDARVDLADRDLRLVIEADSFEYHGGRAGLTRDARRYDELTARGWTVLRLTYDDVTADPEWVRAVVEATVRHLHSSHDDTNDDRSA
ncbi:MAG: DUF559 domain-containing protein [Mobilicoccus sp.]|nr:DUF559 domain-containing protein [Mobilicoccus sp.]